MTDPKPNAPEPGPFEAPRSPLPGAARGYAGFWRRLAALALDLALSFLLALAVAFVLGAVLGAIVAATGRPEILDRVDFPLGVVLAAGVPLLYFTAWESSAARATPGKLAVGASVSDMQGRRVSFGRALGRNLGKVASALTLFGALLAVVTFKKRALHDLIAGTVVVRNG